MNSTSRKLGDNMAIDDNHDSNLRASGRIEAPLALQNDPLAWGPLTFHHDAEGLRFEVCMNVEELCVDEIEVLVSRLPLAVESAVLAISGTATKAIVDSYSYPDSPQTRQVSISVTTSWEVEAFIDRDPASKKRGTKVFETVLLATDRRLPELYKIFGFGVRAAQTILPVAGLWAFTTILEDDTPANNLDHLDDLLEKMSRDGFDVALPKPRRKYNMIRASAMHANPKNWMPEAGEVEWFQEAARQYLLWRAEKGPSAGARRNMRE